ncbi:capsular exopolysaccharide family domain protein [Synechococcus sp. Minos11]|uniref:GumC family protein n=1 Tax=Synechococcus sp. Minos11 TaxID=221341 RepID=UPI0016469ACF|nr:Wzz/FepE/Etk N-terminal domain-containing protein [Synechococcus sp. Minos11]QNJ07662.1 capsular exopolysaccharide family domain protein [Synechococcus sp. Minos11]
MTNSIPAPALEKLQQPAQSINNDEIDLREVARTLGRHSKLIAGVTATMVLLSGFNALSQKPVWEGQFQIVLEDKDSGQRGLFKALQANSLFSQFTGNTGTSRSSLKTEVKILTSPSVLMPVYQFVKKQKQQQGIDVEGFRLSDWVGNVKVDLQRGTSVLNISYQDTDKKLILPVIRLISKTYQDYSGRDRTRGISQSVSYLEKQISELRKESAKSMRSAQAFALDNGLPLEGSGSLSATGLMSSQMAQGNSLTGGATLGPSSIDSSRSAAQSKVNSLMQQLAAARAAGENTVYVAPQFEANIELYGELQQLQSQLEEKLALLKPNDQSIQALKRRISSRTAYINQQTIGLLEGQLNTAQAQLTSVTRPRDVVLKHRELMSKALRDEKTLAGLEGQLQVMQLEKARQTEPWELISTPTLLDNPVAPNKKKIVALGVLGGLVLGAGAALVVDRRRGLVFSKGELKKALPCPLLKQLNVADPSSWVEPIELLAAGTLANPGDGAIALIPVGTVPNGQLDQFGRTLQQAIGNRELKITTDLLQSRDCSHQLLLASPGGANRLQLEHLKMRLALQGKPVTGWVLLDKSQVVS